VPQRTARVHTSANRVVLASHSAEMVGVIGEADPPGGRSGDGLGANKARAAAWSAAGGLKISLTRP